MGKHYVTMGQGHVHIIDGQRIDKDSVAVIEAETWNEGRGKAWDLFGARFCTSYQDDEWNEAEMMPYFPNGYVHIK